MVNSKNIAIFLNEILNIKDFKEGSNNGLQVENQGEIKKIGFAVDAHMETFLKAKELGCEMVVVHHGISFGDSLKYITNQNYNRIKTLISNNIALYGCHLPLDAHKDYGNNIQIAKFLNLKNITEFGNYHDITIGFKGEFETEIALDELVGVIEQKLGYSCPKVLDFGKKQIKTIGIVSGGGGSLIHEAIEEGLDCYLTGEIPHHVFHETKEGKINLIEAGHYATETTGVKALMKLIENKFNIKTVFIDSPTGL